MNFALCSLTHNIICRWSLNPGTNCATCNQMAHDCVKAYKGFSTLFLACFFCCPDTRLLFWYVFFSSFCLNECETCVTACQSTVSVKIFDTVLEAWDVVWRYTKVLETKTWLHWRTATAKRNQNCCRHIHFVHWMVSLQWTVSRTVPRNYLWVRFRTQLESKLSVKQ